MINENELMEMIIRSNVSKLPAERQPAIMARVELILEPIRSAESFDSLVDCMMALGLAGCMAERVAEEAGARLKGGAP